MRLNVSTSIDVTAREKAGDNLLFLGFHGFSNDENEMIRIIDAIYDVPKRDASSTDNSIAPAQHPNYLSFQGTYERPYIGSYYWYPDGCSVGERRVSAVPWAMPSYDCWIRPHTRISARY